MYDKIKKHTEYIKYKEAWNRASKRFYIKNREEILAKMKEDRKLRPEFHKKRKKAWYEKNREKILKYSQIRQKRMRMELLERLGNKCIICGEENERFLQFDRIKGGYHHRTKDWVKNHIKEFQILCANHHNEKSVYNQIIYKGKCLNF